MGICLGKVVICGKKEREVDKEVGVGEHFDWIYDILFLRLGGECKEFVKSSIFFHMLKIFLFFFFFKLRKTKGRGRRHH